MQRPRRAARCSGRPGPGQDRDGAGRQTLCDTGVSTPGEVTAGKVSRCADNTAPKSQVQAVTWRAGRASAAHTPRSQRIAFRGGVFA